ncbi:MAG TPA: aspartate aminotransferase family protein [Pirellulales bacterium]|nr:aspartate aminotransferase family protein [Pirellulales bacterium]
MTSTATKLLARFLDRTPKSARLAQRARKCLPAGIAHDGRFQGPYPIYIEHAAGSRKWDVDGHEYVDYSGGHGALLLGHNHPAVVRAVSEQLARGTHFGSCHELEVRWAEKIVELVPSAQRVRFTSSGTEATLLALRLARAFTGRSKIVRFAGHFHGWHDHMAFGVTSHFDGTPTPGVLPGVAQEVRLVPAGDPAAVTAALGPGDVAAVIIEPTGGSWGQIPFRPGFLAELRELTAAAGVVLIFDEVISGFRCSPGGAQAHCGITPDLTTLAKIVAGGLPGGAIAGRSEILDQLDAAACQRTGREKVPHQGTFNANPLSAAAGVATLEIVADGQACRRANDYAARLRSALSDVLRRNRSSWVVYGTFSGFHLFTNPQRLPLAAEEIESGAVDYRTLKDVRRELVDNLKLAMLVHGVDLFSWPGGPTSAVHTDDDLARTVAAFESSLACLGEEGLL